MLLLLGSFVGACAVSTSADFSESNATESVEIIAQYEIFPNVVAYELSDGHVQYRAVGNEAIREFGNMLITGEMQVEPGIAGDIVALSGSSGCPASLSLCPHPQASTYTEINTFGYDYAVADANFTSPAFSPQPYVRAHAGVCGRWWVTGEWTCFEDEQFGYAGTRAYKNERFYSSGYGYTSAVACVVDTNNECYVTERSLSVKL